MTILLIEDTQADIELLKRRLRNSYQLEVAQTLQDGLSRLAQEDFAAVLLDLNLPDSQGLATLSKVLGASTTPIVVLTGLEDEALGDEAIRRGAQDYLVKGKQDERTLKRSLRYATERHALKENLNAALQREAYLKELTSLEGLSHMTSMNATAQSLGLGTLRKSAPDLFEDLVARYLTALEQALEARVYKVEHDDVTSALRAITETLGAVRAGARDVIEIHTTALGQKHRSSSPLRSQAYTEEGRLLLLELMGRLVAHYRPYALGRRTGREGEKV